MDNILEFYDEGIQIENKNIILNDGKIEENSYNLEIPINQNNNDLIYYGRREKPQTTYDCLLNLNNQLLHSQLNIDKVNVQKNTIDCTLYPNKMINNTLNTEIRKLLYSIPPIKWDAFTYTFAGEGVPNWHFVGHGSALVNFYFNGANNHWLTDRVHGIRYGYSANNLTQPYQYKGIGAFKDFQLHPRYNVMNIITSINSAYRQTNTSFIGDLIDTNEFSVNEFPYLISGYEKVMPYNRQQWCCWGIGENRRGNHATVYKDGRYSVPVAKLGSHICTEENDGTIVFNRDCQIQIQRIHFWGNHGNVTPAQMTAPIKFSKFTANDSETVLYEFSGNFSDTVYALRGCRSMTNPTVQQFFGGAPITQTITLKKGDKLRLYIYAQGDDKLKVSYLNVTMKWEYVENSYEVTDDDWDVDMEYYSGIKTQFLNYEDANVFTANNIEDGKLFEVPYLDCFYDHLAVTLGPVEEWEEYPVYNYYGYFTNLGELTPIKLLADICVKKGWYIIRKPNGTLKLSHQPQVQTLEDCELISIEFLNDKFGKANYVEFANGQKYVGTDDTNQNLQQEKTLYKLYAAVPKIQGIYPLVEEYEQDGGVDEDGTCKFHEVGNYYHIDRDADIANDVKWFDFVATGLNSSVYTYNVPTTNIYADFALIDGLLYMITDTKIDLEKQSTEITCFRV